MKALVLELEELKQEQASYKLQITAVEEAIKSYQDQVDALVAEVAKTEVKINKYCVSLSILMLLCDPLNLRL